MTIDKHILTVTLNGSGAGTATTPKPIRGAVLGVHLDYTATGSGTDVILTSGTPEQTILSVANSNTDGNYAPVMPLHLASDGTTIAGQYSVVIIDDTVTLTVAGGTAAGTVTATLRVLIPD